ncbi:hypothetical protein [Pedobacter agri]|uniref:Uncharacterized protein n=1 Tax=Pedobacter agri TaxID=454586 RepID=A0A9X3DFY3_9SPHI|nr:hypothetical protein [Pedobacter agri]MCX3266527.1 hypothetical protein [Pedobacter agri]
MKKILIIPVMLVCLAGSSRRVEPIKPIIKQSNVIPINTKVDSLAIGLHELDSLIHKL